MNISLMKNEMEIRQAFIEKFTMTWDEFRVSHKEWIDALFEMLGNWVANIVPAGAVQDGVAAGLSGGFFRQGGLRHYEAVFQAGL